MRYYKSAQFIPGKGEAWTYYECTDNQLIQRYVTHIPTTSEVEKVPEPVIKTLFRPDLLVPIDEPEFLAHWGLA
ncbi:MAG: hypothetical protein HZA54_18695 [Planctomycetes bacterium]|nr:hypothetical protein [Planctomycetota bacterium]